MHLSLEARELRSLVALDDLVDFGLHFDDVVVELVEVGVDVVNHLLHHLELHVQRIVLLALHLQQPALQLRDAVLGLQHHHIQLLGAFRHLGNALALILDHVAHNHLQLLLLLHNILIHLL